MTIISTRIDELIFIYGSLSNVAHALNIDKGYLSRLKSGEKANPSSKTLVKLGLYKVTEYRHMKENNGKST